jgi:hypothetical protein
MILFHEYFIIFMLGFINYGLDLFVKLFAM